MLLLHMARLVCRLITFFKTLLVCLPCEEELLVLLLSVCVKDVSQLGVRNAQCCESQAPESIEYNVRR